MKRRIILGVVVTAVSIGFLGCSLFSANHADTELVFAATEVGIPEGDQVTKDIGPAGGTVTSPDGRMTLTVPQNALAETVAFTIQPITNRADGGQGLAYRFGPDGKVFPIPLEITLKYGEDDLKGTVAEALLVAFQNQKGEWQQLKPKTFDPKNKTVSVTTTHFTDTALLSRMRINPTSATVYVGKSKGIEFIECREPGIIERLRGVNWRSLCSQYSKVDWELTGPGTLEPAFGDASKDGKVPGYLYTAPAQFPVNNNIAFVDASVQFEVQDPTTGRLSTVSGKFRSVITIVDRGYKATGQTADVKWSGSVCSLEKPFTISGSVINYKLNFVPSSPTGGTTSIGGAGLSVVAIGSGTYTIEGADTDTPRIVLAASAVGHSPVGSRTGSGTIYINLIRLETDECK